ncbi:hypothetical protein ACOXXX_18390 [Thalassococcus sp. BH17M4-6]|uniref:hypothetical protein n=1 Tax=Thalassococcus sp. BH17M4-6 TaxID=3413148 RepID=UPI003BCA255F
MFHIFLGISGRRLWCLAGSALALLPLSAQAQNVHPQNTTIYDHLCIGADCLNTEVYPDSVGNMLRLKAVVPGIEFQDTSTSAGYPNTNWKIQGNGASADNQNRLLFLDDDAGRAVLALEAGARSNALFVSGQGAIGVGTSIPQSEMAIYDSTVNGFGTAIELTAEGTTGSVIYSDTGRIVMGASLFGEGTLTFLGAAGITAPVSFSLSAPTDSLRVTDNGDVGLGASQPDAALHVERGDGTAGIKVENNSSSPVGAREMFNMTNNGGSYFTLDNTASGTTWYFTHEQAAPNRFIIADAVADGPEMSLSADGILTVPGGFVVGSTALNVPDYVFADDYALKPLSEVSAFIADNRHLPDVPSAADVARDGLDMAQMQLAQLRKIEELTLYTLGQQAVIEAQAAENAVLTRETAALATRLARIEALLQQP